MNLNRLLEPFKEDVADADTPLLGNPSGKVLMEHTLNDRTLMAVSSNPTFHKGLTHCFEQMG